MNDTPSDWLTDLSTAVAECLVVAAGQMPIGAHVQAGEDEVPEVSLFFGATEIVGGAQDGRRRNAPFWLDLVGLLQVFKEVEEFAWQAASMGPDDDLGPHVSLSGRFDGRPVRVRVLAASPRQFPAAQTAESRRNAVANRW